jgi:tRNA-dihydrouridine synthase
VDLLPENNSDLPIIPQLLNTDAEDFLVLADHMYDLGYTHINWNLGCPVPMIAKKKRGSGILPYPEMIIDFLEKILPRLKMKLSIKTRLGYYNPNEILTLLPLLDVFPLQEIIIHARLGKQLYAGSVDLEGFARCRNATRHELVYNGDITNVAFFYRLQKQFPWVARWMIGRGALADPSLILSLHGIPTDPQEHLTKLQAFHADLFQSMRERLSGPGHLLGRMKQLWLYLIASFPNQKKVLKKIKKATTEDQYLAAIEEIFNNSEMIRQKAPLTLNL